MENGIQLVQLRRFRKNQDPKSLQAGALSVASWATRIKILSFTVVLAALAALVLGTLGVALSKVYS